MKKHFLLLIMVIVALVVFILFLKQSPSNDNNATDGDNFFVDTDDKTESSEDFSGLWSYDGNPQGDSVLIFNKNQDRYTVSISALRGGGAQVATANVENVQFTDGVAEFYVVDSFGNRADCTIVIKNQKLTIAYSNIQQAEYANWGVVLSSGGYYTKTQEISQVSQGWIDSIEQEIEWAQD